VCFKTKKAAEFAYGEPKLTKQESALRDSIERDEWK
jgi:hypothetical protein